MSWSSAGKARQPAGRAVSWVNTIFGWLRCGSRNPAVARNGAIGLMAAARVSTLHEPGPLALPSTTHSEALKKPGFLWLSGHTGGGAGKALLKAAASLPARLRVGNWERSAPRNRRASMTVRHSTPDLHEVPRGDAVNVAVTTRAQEMRRADGAGELERPLHGMPFSLAKPHLRRVRRQNRTLLPSFVATSRRAARLSRRRARSAMRSAARDAKVGPDLSNSRA